MQVIDCDAHIDETEDTWEFLREEELAFKPTTGYPANPDPNKQVRWGPQTYDEMMIGYVEYYVPSATPKTTAAR